MPASGERIHESGFFILKSAVEDDHVSAMRTRAKARDYMLGRNGVVIVVAGFGPRLYPSSTASPFDLLGFRFHFVRAQRRSRRLRPVCELYVCAKASTLPDQ